MSGTCQLPASAGPKTSKHDVLVSQLALRIPGFCHRIKMVARMKERFPILARQPRPEERDGNFRAAEYVDCCWK